MWITDPTDIHMTGTQAQIGAGAESVFLDTLDPTGVWIMFRKPNGETERGFQLRAEADALVGVARVARLRPSLRVEATNPQRMIRHAL